MNGVRALCDRICDKLFASIRGARCLSEPEKRALLELWCRSDVHTQMVEGYPGHAAFARALGMSPRQTSAVLRRLERKGFVKRTGTAQRVLRRPTYLLNALLLEMAYDASARSR